MVKSISETRDPPTTPYSRKYKPTWRTQDRSQLDTMTYGYLMRLEQLSKIKEPKFLHNKPRSENSRRANNNVDEVYDATFRIDGARAGSHETTGNATWQENPNGVDRRSGEGRTWSRYEAKITGTATWANDQAGEVRTSSDENRSPQKIRDNAHTASALISPREARRLSNRVMSDIERMVSIGTPQIQSNDMR